MAKGDKGGLVLALSYLPLMAFFTFFYALPILSILFSTDATQLVSLLGDPYIIRLTVDTTVQAIASTVPSIMLAIPLAYFLSRYAFRGANLLRYLLLTPFFVPAFAVTEGIILMLGERGILNQILAALLRIDPPVLDVLYSMVAVVIAHVFYYLPLAVLILEQGFSSVDRELVDASEVSGASWFLTLKVAYLNRMIPFVTASSLLVFAFSFITYSTPILIGGKFTTLEVEIYSTRARPVSSSLALFQLMFTFLLSLAILALREKLYVKDASSTRGRMPKTPVLTTSGKVLLGYAIVLVAIELLPVYLVLAQSISSSTVVLFPTALSLDNLIRLFGTEFGFGIGFIDVILQSFSIATVVALFSVFASVLIVWQGSKREDVRKLMTALLSFPLSISRSSLALGMMLCYGFGFLRLYGSWTLIAAGHIAIIVPLITRVMEASWTRISPEVRDAAELFGASGIFRLLKVELPLIAPAIVASFLLAFSSSISEFTFSNFFSTLNLMTLPVSAAVLIDLRRLDLAAALNGLVIVVVMAAEAATSLVSEEAIRVV